MWMRIILVLWKEKIVTNFEIIWRDIVGNLGTFFRYTPYVPWAIWLAKSRFHEYAWGRGDQSFSNEIAYYN